ncbi:SMP-30/gluconolactonase/LRE family protein [Ornithinimicrobium pekingense]|uniref:Gluconolactonase n=1 Tax=Ornithinimicrobium pekingense TaxID=384677 RepID=A0ABQ2F4D5_9MICO|nr:SMP-30/gluconolactonase/LRE family protein [Ornithinimicrobium pekingense]GGK60161.1 gluconolactonase [Ornithinimicrobium pekingense]
MTARLEQLADGLAFPEGPVVLPDGSVAVVEMAADLVTFLEPDGSRRSVPCGPGPNGLALTPEGELVVCLNGGLGFERHEGRLHPGLAFGRDARGGVALLQPQTGQVTPLVPWGARSRVSAPNDVALPTAGPSADGGFWFTDLGRRFVDHQEHGGVYWCGPDGDLGTAAYPRFGRPNGIGLSPDGRTLYVTESQSAQVWAWEVLGPGHLGQARLVHQLPHPCRLDGMAVTASGTLVVATLVVGQLTALSPHGEVVGQVDVDDPFPTNVVVDPAEEGGLLVTLGSTGRLVRLRLDL